MTPSEFDWLTALCEREYSRVIAYCRNHLEEEQDAHDACQETFTRAVLHWDKVRACERPGGWLMEAARLVCMEVQRRRYQWTHTLRPGPWHRDQAPIDGAEAEQWRRREAGSRSVPRTEVFYRRECDRRAETFERRQRLSQLAAVAEELPEKERAVIRLALQGWAAGEIAAQLCLNEATVHTRMHRARTHMIELIEERRER